MWLCARLIALSIGICSLTLVPLSLSLFSFLLDHLSSISTLGYDLYDGELRDCTVSSHDEVMYFDRLVVQCRLPRTPRAPNLYVMEVYSGDDMTLLLNVSSGTPQFIIASRSLGSVDQLVLLIYSVNADTNVRSQRTVRLAVQTNPYTAPLASIGELISRSYTYICSNSLPDSRSTAKKK